ncbi:MAG: hypothetical protein M1821_007261 [Bathelium mastoideum]|nr:MAG: hypothetical protein M1821_007261 [Bathelium mastoideum]
MASTNIFPSSSRHIAGIAVCDTPLIRKALDFAKAHLREFAYYHVVRCWIFGTLLIPYTTAQDSGEELFDHEAFSVAVILHELGWALTTPLVSKDKRFEVDGANAAREFLRTESSNGDEKGKWDKHRLQLVWDTIALHTTPSIATHKQPEVATASMGIFVDLLGPKSLSMLPPTAQQFLTEENFGAVVNELPRTGWREGCIEALCELCRTKPETTYDNFVGAFGEKYLEGFTCEGKTILDAFDKMA